MLDEGLRHPYIIALENVERILRESYERIYGINIFDWWQIDPSESSQASIDDQEKQMAYEDQLNDGLKLTLKRLNVFNFARINRDLLGHIYEDYLPKDERKALGEFYTPLQIVHYILDHVGYTSDRDIGEIKVLDPACGSGTFLVRAVDRLIKHYLKKFGKRFVDQFEPDEAKVVLDAIINR